MEEHSYSVYMMTNPTNKVLYIGVTNDLLRRVREHQSGIVSGFTQKYNCCKLVYFEETSEVYSALEREKELKKWRREKKDALIATTNPQWHDLYFSILS